jgi:SNF2 family DNA or RNA helicase
MKDISKTVKCEHRLLLTGTPVQNCLAELATLMAFALSDGKKNQVPQLAFLGMCF